MLRPSAAFLWAASGVALAGGLTAGLFVVYRNADAQRVSTVLDIVRIGLSVGAGTGGLFALWLATRRQRSAEQTLVLQREVSESTVTDTTERRITDQYSKAIDQLGHEKGAVRLGAVYSLERIAQDHPGHRQTVLDVFSSYLRLPFVPPADRGAQPGLAAGKPAEAAETHAELEVRYTIQSMFWEHLGDPTKRGSEGRFWPDLDLDLSRTVLVDPIFRQLRVRNLKCEGTVVHGLADFADIQADGVCGFGGAKFLGRLILARSVFRTGLTLMSSSFEAEVDLSAITVANPFMLGKCQFSGEVDLSGCKSGGLVVSESVFADDVLFGSSRFDLIMVTESEFRGEFQTSGLEVGSVAMVVGSRFRTPPDRHEKIVHVESLSDPDGLTRALAGHFGVEL